jgi:hypothetical protein
MTHLPRETATQAATQAATQSAHVPDFSASAVTCPPAQAVAAAAGAPPVIAGESRAAYDELLGRMTRTLAPADVLEHMFLRDIVDLAWEVLRLRRLKANLMACAAHRGVATLLRPLIEEDDERALLARGWVARRDGAVEKVESLLAAAGFGPDHVAAATFSSTIYDMERIDRMMAAAERRRNSALFHIEHHRERFGRELRRALDEVTQPALDPASATAGQA